MTSVSRSHHTLQSTECNLLLVLIWTESIRSPSRILRAFLFTPFPWNERHEKDGYKSSLALPHPKPSTLMLVVAKPRDEEALYLVARNWRRWEMQYFFEVWNSSRAAFTGWLISLIRVSGWWNSGKIPRSAYPRCASPNHYCMIPLECWVCRTGCFTLIGVCSLKLVMSHSIKSTSYHFLPIEGLSEFYAFLMSFGKLGKGVRMWLLWTCVATILRHLLGASPPNVRFTAERERVGCRNL